MKLGIKVNDSITKEIAATIKSLDNLPKEAHKEFIAVTPIDKGNARRSTTLNDRTITADYQYAQRLDQGWSKQAPKGMIEPWLRWLDKRLKQIVEK